MQYGTASNHSATLIPLPTSAVFGLCSGAHTFSLHLFPFSKYGSLTSIVSHFRVPLRGYTTFSEILHLHVYGPFHSYDQQQLAHPPINIYKYIYTVYTVYIYPHYRKHQ